MITTDTLKDAESITRKLVRVQGREMTPAERDALFITLENIVKDAGMRITRDW